MQVLPGKSLALVGASGSGKCAPPHCDLVQAYVLCLLQRES